jgi:hypothetical protein
LPDSGTLKLIKKKTKHHMKRVLFIFTIITAIISGCGKKAETTSNTETPKTATDSQSSTPATTEANATPAIPLKETKGELMGFTVLIPEKAEEFTNTDTEWSYNLQVTDFHAVMVRVKKITDKIKSIEEAIAYTSTEFEGLPGVKEQKVIGEDYRIIKKPIGGGLQHFWYFAKKKDGFIALKCTAHPSYEATCLQIVNSFKLI